MLTLTRDQSVKHVTVQYMLGSTRDESVKHVAVQYAIICSGQKLVSPCPQAISLGFGIVGLLP